MLHQRNKAQNYLAFHPDLWIDLFDLFVNDFCIFGFIGLKQEFANGSSFQVLLLTAKKQNTSSAVEQSAKVQHYVLEFFLNRSGKLIFSFPFVRICFLLFDLKKFLASEKMLLFNWA